jgi:hypothetical protein
MNQHPTYPKEETKTNKFMKLDDIPEEVMEVWAIQSITGGMMGSEMYQKCMEAFKKYPKYFHWEHTYYHVVPKEVHEAFKDELYPDRHKPIEYKGNGLIPDVMAMKPTVVECSPSTKSLNELLQEMVDIDNRAKKEERQHHKKVKAIWDKHYSKYKIEYRNDY